MQIDSNSVLECSLKHYSENVKENSIKYLLNEEVTVEMKYEVLLGTIFSASREAPGINSDIFLYWNKTV